MKIGTLGAGVFAQAFAKRALKAGYKVKLSNSRGPDSLREIINRLGPGAMAATKEEAAAIDLGNLRDGGLIQQAGGPLAGRDFFERGES